jgi:hypothetical protein
MGRIQPLTRLDVEAKEKLWEFFNNEHEMLLTQGQLDDIIEEVTKFINVIAEKPKQYSVVDLNKPTLNNP